MYAESIDDVAHTLGRAVFPEIASCSPFDSYCI
jgi:hypothetical protein